METVLARFDQTVAAHPRRPAIFWDRETIRYNALHKRIDALAGHLQHHHHIQPGDHVGLLLKNSPEFICALYALLKSGAVVVPINTFLKAPEIHYIATDCRLKLLVTSPEFHSAAGNLPLVNAHECPAAPPPTWPAVSASDLAVIIYTSGTTGKPKGAMLTHGNFAANIRSCITALEETPNDRLTVLLPMFHSFMLTVGIFTPLSMGAGIVLIKSVQPFKLALKEIIRHRATVFLGIPQIYQAMAHAPIPFWLHWVLRLRIAVSGAAPLPRETLEAFERKFRFPLLEGYGLSEAAPVVSFNPVHGVRKPGSVGLPLPDVEVNIFDPNDGELPVGDIGEIVVRGPNVMRGYFNQSQENEVTLRNGWLHTGDIGKFDTDGYLYVVDRKKEMLLVRGLNVYPREIEEVLYQLPGVAEAAVIAKPDPHRGEAPVAFVRPAEGKTLQSAEVMKFCRERLADYKVPREIRIVESLPHTATGKVAKAELRKML